MRYIKGVAVIIRCAQLSKEAQAPKGYMMLDAIYLNDTIVFLSTTVGSSNTGQPRNADLRKTKPTGQRRNRDKPATQAHERPEKACSRTYNHGFSRHHCCCFFLFTDTQ